MKKNKMLYRIVAAVLACAVVALALVTYQSRSSSNAPVAEKAVELSVSTSNKVVAINFFNNIKTSFLCIR